MDIASLVKELIIEAKVGPYSNVIQPRWPYLFFAPNFG